MSNETDRKRIKEIEVMVADAISETDDTTTLILFTGNDRLDYKPGHFLTISPHQFPAIERFTAFLEDLKGKKEKPRAYSMASAPDEKYLAITIKEERYTSGETKYPPLLSPLLVRRTLRGMRMFVTGFTGPYVLPDDIIEKTGHVIHICAGSGIVPNYSILKYALRNHPKLRHTLFYSNRTWEDAIFRKELTELTQKHPNLKIVHSLTRNANSAPSDVQAVAGRLTTEVIAKHVDDLSEALFFACGPAIGPWDKARAKERGQEPPPRFLESALKSLTDLGVDKKKIKYESYG